MDAFALSQIAGNLGLEFGSAEIQHGKSHVCVGFPLHDIIGQGFDQGGSLRHKGFHGFLINLKAGDAT